MEYIKKEWKKLGSMGLIGVGAFLILEHIYTYGGINFFDILGHEWMGILLVVGGLFTAHKYNGLTFKESWKEQKEKLKYIFGGKK